MRLMRGETTTVMPSSSSAGTWKQADFPAPVGSTASVSRPDSTDADDVALGRAEVGEPEMAEQHGAGVGEGRHAAHSPGAVADVTQMARTVTAPTRLARRTPLGSGARIC